MPNYTIDHKVAGHLGIAKRSVELIANQWNVPFNEALVQVFSILRDPVQSHTSKTTIGRNELFAMLTPETLNLVTILVRSCGWSVDYIETRNFLQYLYEVAEVPFPDDLDPYKEE